VIEAYKAQNPTFKRWLKNNVTAHRHAGYNVVTVSLKSPNRPPGDITADQMDAVAELAERYSFGEICATHEQNLILGHVSDVDLYAVWEGLAAQDLATPNAGLLTDLICCPGLDFCALANSGSIGVAGALTRRFADLDMLETLGELKIKMSGCINACGHHHVGHIGILGISKNGEEFYQVMLGGSASDDASLGQWLGPAVPQARVVDAIERIVHAFMELRQPGERFLDAYRRVGPAPFKEAVYDAA
jgi:sulfite reductase (NADPH) hemoprotein beta-component